MPRRIERDLLADQEELIMAEEITRDKTPPGIQTMEKPDGQEKESANLLKMETTHFDVPWRRSLSVKSFRHVPYLILRTYCYNGPDCGGRGEG